MSTQRCEFEFDGYMVTQCEAPARFTVSRADGDQSYSGGKDAGVNYACPSHVAEALFGMADGDAVDLVVKLHYDNDTTAAMKAAADKQAAEIDRLLAKRNAR